METESDTIELNRSQNLILNRQENLLAIRENDWKRLKRIVKRCSPISEWWSAISSFFGGIAASLIATLITISLQPTGFTNEIKFILILTCVFCIIVAIICFVVHRREKRIRKTYIVDIQDTIEDIELNFCGQIVSEQQ